MRSTKSLYKRQYSQHFTYGDRNLISNEQPHSCIQVSTPTPPILCELALNHVGYNCYYGQLVWCVPGSDWQYFTEESVYRGITVFSIHLGNCFRSLLSCFHFCRSNRYQQTSREIDENTKSLAQHTNVDCFTGAKSHKFRYKSCWDSCITLYKTVLINATMHAAMQIQTTLQTNRTSG